MLAKYNKDIGQCFHSIFKQVINSGIDLRSNATILSLHGVPTILRFCSTDSSFSPQLVSLPRETTVRKVLQDYLDSRKLDDITNETIAGLLLYFNTSLGNCLLYRQERQQYGDIRNTHGDKQLVDVYGPEHLLRLFGTSSVFYICTF
jgi:hypothetical protein